MSEMVPTELDRVRSHTARKVNAEIDTHIEESIYYFAQQPPQVMTKRIEELEREWDIERVLEVNASSLAFIGTMLGAFVNHWFLVIPALVTAFLFQHAIQGWCPPLPVLRRMGKRTRNEIDVEKFAMKALRGDFELLHDSSYRSANPESVIDAVRHYSR